MWWSEQKYPGKIYSTGGRAIRQDNTDAPDHQVAVYNFDGFTLEWEHRNFAANNAEKTDPQQAVGVYFYGTEGTFHMGWLDGWTFYPANPNKQVIHQNAELTKPDDQNIQQLYANFLTSIKTNRRYVRSRSASVPPMWHYWACCRTNWARVLSGMERKKLFRETPKQINC